MFKMKADKWCAINSLWPLALATVMAGCRHKVIPGAPVSEAPPKVTPPAPTASLTAVPESVERGGSIELTWNTANATVVTIDGIGTISASGSQKVTPQILQPTVSLQPANRGSAEASARVTVSIPIAAIPDPTDEELFAKNGKDIFFDFAKYDVRTDETQTADSDATFLVQHPEIAVLIEGHCDDRGSDEYNLSLGENRASVVRDRLIQLGVNAGRIRVVSFGKERPFSTVNDDSCWSENRRAHFVFESGNRASANLPKSRL